jgi:hypothetical protein
MNGQRGKRVKLAEQSLDAQRVEVNFRALFEEERPVAGLALLRLKDVQMHVSFLSEDDLVGAGEAGGLSLDLPDDIYGRLPQSDKRRVFW